MRTPGNTWESKVFQQMKHVSRVTISLWNASKSARMPLRLVQEEFGIYSIEHVLAVKWCIDNKLVLPQDLEDAKNSGDKIKKIILLPKNPHSSVDFVTIRDLLRTN